MLSVSKCGYDNDYGRKYESYHPVRDLAKLKELEKFITVKGGEYSGALYYLLVCLPASMKNNEGALLYYKVVKDLFSYQGVEKNRLEALEDARIDWFQFFSESLNNYMSISGIIIKICDIMIRNYNVYSDVVWKESRVLLNNYSRDVNFSLNRLKISEKWHSFFRPTFLQDKFEVILCQGLENGPEAIDISQNQDVFGIDRSIEMQTAFISHEYGIYLLKRVLADTPAFTEMKYYKHTEGLAEFYNNKIYYGKLPFYMQKEACDFYTELANSMETTDAKKLFLAAIEKMDI